MSKNSVSNSITNDPRDVVPPVISWILSFAGIQTFSKRLFKFRFSFKPKRYFNNVCTNRKKNRIKPLHRVHSCFTYFRNYTASNLYLYFGKFMKMNFFYRWRMWTTTSFYLIASSKMNKTRTDKTICSGFRTHDSIITIL